MIQKPIIAVVILWVVTGNSNLEAQDMTFQLVKDVLDWVEEDTTRDINDLKDAERELIYVFEHNKDDVDEIITSYFIARALIEEKMIESLFRNQQNGCDNLRKYWSKIINNSKGLREDSRPVDINILDKYKLSLGYKNVNSNSILKWSEKQKNRVLNNCDTQLDCSQKNLDKTYQRFGKHLSRVFDVYIKYVNTSPESMTRYNRREIRNLYDYYLKGSNNIFNDSSNLRNLRKKRFGKALPCNQGDLPYMLIKAMLYELKEKATAKSNQRYDCGDAHLYWYKFAYHKDWSDDHINKIQEYTGRINFNRAWVKKRFDESKRCAPTTLRTCCEISNSTDIYALERVKEKPKITIFVIPNEILNKFGEVSCCTTSPLHNDTIVYGCLISDAVNYAKDANSSIYFRPDVNANDSSLCSWVGILDSCLNLEEYRNPEYRHRFAIYPDPKYKKKCACLDPKDPQFDPKGTHHHWDSCSLKSISDMSTIDIIDGIDSSIIGKTDTLTVGTVSYRKNGDDLIIEYIATQNEDAKLIVKKSKFKTGRYLNHFIARDLNEAFKVPEKVVNDYMIGQKIQDFEIEGFVRGETDSQPIKDSGITYKENISINDSFLYEGIIHKIQLEKGDKIYRNKELAFLRAFFVRNHMYEYNLQNFKDSRVELRVRTNDGIASEDNPDLRNIVVELTIPGFFIRYKELQELQDRKYRIVVRKREIKEGNDTNLKTKIFDCNCFKS